MMVPLPLDRDALVVAMTLVPGLYSRNRMFALFKDPEIKRARFRAAELRGIVRQLAGMHGEAELVEFARPAAGAHETDRGHAVLCFRIPPIRFARRIELTELEAACVAYLCGRAGVTCVRPAPDDRALLDGALRRLSGGLHLAGLEVAPGEPRAPS